MASRIDSMRHAVYKKLIELKTPGTWTHFINQIGMFTYTGLTLPQVQMMKSKFHVYMMDSGRISMPGLNEENVGRFAEAIDYVVRHV
jgi:aspartate aminotransferase, cytoplasmic